MAPYKNFLFLIFILLYSKSFSQTNDKLTLNEKACVDFFGKFLQHSKRYIEESYNSDVLTDSARQPVDSQILNDSIKLVRKIRDSSEIKFVLSEFILSINIKSEISPAEQFKTASAEIYELYDFFKNSIIANFKIRPLRLSNDDQNKFIYNNLTDFQKENTFILFEKNKPKELLGYILFAPAKTINSSLPRILSWKLTFCYGHYYFTNILGHVGLEYLFQGVKGPKIPIDIKKEVDVLEK